LSCSNSNREGSNLTDISSNRDSVISNSDTNGISINATYPFGCADLTKINYPKKWDADLEHYGQLKKPAGKEYENIYQCFQTINTTKVIVTPTTRKIEHLIIGDNFKNNQPNLILQTSADSCRFRLPNVGIYECYYSYRQDANSLALYGNLLLLDPKTKNGKILNVYFQGYGESYVVFRYFVIDKNVINIYEGYCCDDGCSLDFKFKIAINQDNILIEPITNLNE